MLRSLVAQTVESACSVGDPGSIPGSGRSPGEGNSNPLQYSCLKNPMDGGAWRATERGVAESDMTERLHFHFPSARHPPAHVCRLVTTSFSCDVKCHLLVDTALCPSCEEAQLHEPGEFVPLDKGPHLLGSNNA